MSEEKSDDLKEKDYIEPECTGYYWYDEFSEYGVFTHDEFTYCPIHDKKRT